MDVHLPAWKHACPAFETPGENSWRCTWQSPACRLSASISRRQSQRVSPSSGTRALLKSLPLDRHLHLQRHYSQQPERAVRQESTDGRCRNQRGPSIQGRQFRHLLQWGRASRTLCWVEQTSCRGKHCLIAVWSLEDSERPSGPAGAGAAGGRAGSPGAVSSWNWRVKAGGGCTDCKCA